MKGITGFDPVFNHKAVLCGWIGGREAEHMETLSEMEIGQACTKVLRLFLGQQDIPFPKNVYKYVVMVWLESVRTIWKEIVLNHPAMI